MNSRGSPTKGTKSEVANSPLPSRGPKRGRKCYVTPAFLQASNKRDIIRSGYLTPATLEAQKRAEVLRNPCILGGPRQKGQEVAISPLPSWGPKRGRKCYITPAFSRVPHKVNKIRSGCLTPAFWGVKRGRKCYLTPAFLGVPNKGAQDQKWLPHAYLLGGPKEGRSAT